MHETPKSNRSTGQEATTGRYGGISRRQLLRDVAAVSAAATIVPRHVLGGEGNTPPSEKPTLAGIGVGGVGHGQMKACDSVGFQVVALCDVDEVYAKKSIVNYDFPEHEGRPPVRLVWYDGGLRPPRPKQLDGANYPSEGTMYVGDEGVMLGSTVYPLDRGKKFLDVPETLPRRPGTWGEWIEAVRGGEPAGCNFDWAERITEFVLLGNLAIRAGQPLSWDAKGDRFTNSDQANAMLHDEYRAGWTL